MDLYLELSEYLDKLKEYKALLSELFPNPPLVSAPIRDNNPFAIFEGEKYKEKQAKQRDLDNIREYLLRKCGILAPKITELTGNAFVTIHEFGKPRSVNMWDMGLRAEIDYRTSEALNACIDNVNIAIGKLESTLVAELELQEASVTQPPKDTAELPVYLFDKLQFHSKVVEASRELFKDGHYRDAIYRAFVEVNNSVKAKSGKSGLDGKALMSTVFSPNNPIIKLNNLTTQTDKDEQEGFMYLYMGAMQGIRNPKAHENLVQNNPYRTLEYLAFASLLMKRVEEGKVSKLQKGKDAQTI